MTVPAIVWVSLTKHFHEEYPVHTASSDFMMDVRGQFSRDLKDPCPRKIVAVEMNLQPAKQLTLL